MLKYVKMEVAFEIIGMRIALAIENNDIEKIKILNKEREELYNGNMEIFNKIYNVYAKEVKARIKGGDTNDQ